MITMVLTSQNACDILEIPLGADINLVVTKYKQLALKWHPEKHKYSAESVKKFKQVSLAYKRLTSSEFHQDLNMNDCLQLFNQVLFNTAATNGTKYYSDSSESSDDDDDDSEDSDDEQFTSSVFIKKESSSSTKKSENDSKNLTEDEKERKRVEKRRAKKKRQRERKRLEKEQKTNGTSKSRIDKLSDNQEALEKQDNSLDDDTPFDSTSAFFTKVVSKKKKSGPEDQSQARKKDRAGDKKSDDEGDEIVDAKVLRSRQLAIRGNEMAQVEQYTAAIQLFTEAISLDPADFRFFGNRSYCYDRIEQHDKALRDAEKAISLDKDWPKGYFRKGRALAGLKNYADSEKAFLQVLKLDKNCDDAVSELFHVRTRQLMDMGFSSSQSEAAIKKHGSVQAAMDSLLAGVCDSTFGNLHISDGEENNFHLHRPIFVPPHLSHAADTKMDPTNPEGLTALWVGNVLPSVTEKRLTQSFSKYGQVTSVRLLPEKYCAFVNFKTKEGAGRAMHHLQGEEVDGQKLLIKFPDNPIANSTGNFTIRKDITNGATKQGIQPKQKGPVNGDECYFWRTTGCTFGSDCKWKHYPKSKGIDKKPWQK